MYNSMTSTRSRIETSIPRKHGPAIAGYESVCIFFLKLFLYIWNLFLT